MATTDLNMATMDLGMATADLNLATLREYGLWRTVWSRGKAPVDGLERKSPEAVFLHGFLV